MVVLGRAKTVLDVLAPMVDRWSRVHQALPSFWFDLLNLGNLY